ncbi:MAG: hypothetical protein ACT4PV_12300 [Planctomycetaceae bacterium]
MRRIRTALLLLASTILAGTASSRLGAGKEGLDALRPTVITISTVA